MDATKRTTRVIAAAATLGAVLAYAPAADARWAPFIALPSAPTWITTGLLSALVTTPALEDDAAAPVDAEDDALLVCGLFVDGGPRLTLFDDPLFREPPLPEISLATHTDKSGESVTYEQISRRWDRPANYRAYLYPVDTRYNTVTSGYDLDLPETDQRRVSSGVVGHGGVDVPQLRGAPVTLLRLAHQVGEAKLLHVGTIFGNSVATLHTVREGGERARYAVVFGHLDTTNPDLKVGKVVRAGTIVGTAGDSDSPGGVHLHLEVRRVREGVAPETLIADRILSRDATIVTDPRNVLPLHPRAANAPSCRERLRARYAPTSALRLALEPLRPLAYGAIDPR